MEQIKPAGKIDKTNVERRKVILTKEEKEILKWLFFRSFAPVLILLVVSCSVLFFGVQFAINQIIFNNYGIASSPTLLKIPQFIYTYLYLAIANVLLMLYLSFVVIYILVRNLILPVMRITREMKHSVETGAPVKVGVRKNDKLLIPFVEIINKIGEMLRNKA